MLRRVLCVTVVIAVFYGLTEGEFVLKTYFKFNMLVSYCPFEK